MSLLEKALALAVEAHRGQQDKSGAPCILHPLRVLGRVPTEDQQIVALLHDDVADTPWTFEKLATAGFPPHILDTLAGVTQVFGETCEQFIERSASNPVAIRVKLADLEDNLDVRRLPGLTEEDREPLNRYRAACRRLLAA